MNECITIIAPMLSPYHQEINKRGLQFVKVQKCFAESQSFSESRLETQMLDIWKFLYFLSWFGIQFSFLKCV